MRLIDADALCKLAQNSKDRTVDCNDIMRMPTIDAVPVVHGEWIYRNYENGNWYCTCSNCGKGDLHAIKGTVPYCWNCGAKMDTTETDQ